MARRHRERFGSVGDDDQLDERLHRQWAHGRVPVLLTRAVVLADSPGKSPPSRSTRSFGLQDRHRPPSHDRSATDRSRCRVRRARLKRGRRCRLFGKQGRPPDHHIGDQQPDADPGRRGNPGRAKYRAVVHRHRRVTGIVKARIGNARPPGRLFPGSGLTLSPPESGYSAPSVTENDSGSVAAGRRVSPGRKHRENQSRLPTTSWYGSTTWPPDT
jgi:hypothetical protein